MITKRFWTPQCICCQRYHLGKETCDAYPEGVPREIYRNEVSHKTPYEEDHGLMYVEKRYSASKAEDDAPADKAAPFEEAQYTGDGAAEAKKKAGHDPACASGSD